MLRLLLALLSLFAPVASPPSDEPVPVEHPSAPGGSRVERLDVSFPASSSWVAVPVTALEPLELDARVRLPPHAPGARVSADAVFVARESEESGAGMGWTMGHHTAEINANGQRLTCCWHPTVGLLSTPAQGGEAEMIGMQLAQGETVWLAIIVAHADEAYPAEVRLRSFGGAFVLGEPREGTGVEVVDLVDEAYANGVNARLPLVPQIGAAGDATRRWEPEQKGYMTLSYHAVDGASFVLDVAAAGAPVLSGRQVDGFGGFVSALGAGPQAVTLSELTPGPDAFSASAVALVADVDLPGGWTRTHEWPAFD